jgi:RimJ/RimL family protein N-acetyltransferase
MKSVTDLLDEAMADWAGCDPQDLRRHRIVVKPRQKHQLAICVTCDGCVLSTDVLSAGDLDVESGRLLLSWPPTAESVRRVALLVAGAGAKTSHNVLLYCTPETFRPQNASPAEPVRPDDPFWQSDDPEEDRRLEAAFAVYVGDVRASTATVVRQDREPFRAIGISTKPEYRGRGYAKAVLSKATAYALARDSVPLYNTQIDNEASLAAARAVGYVEHMHIINVDSQA